MKTLGVCFGSTTMQCVELAINNGAKEVVNTVRIPHEGNPRESFLNFMKSIDKDTKVVVTGRAFRKSVALSSIAEPEAIEFALREQYQKGQFPSLVISSGGETQLVYTINEDGGISAVHSGNKCASGTGEFFLQQIRRMGLTLEEAVEMAQRGTAHKIAGRCSVFCKSDCTHALNKGEPRENIAAGLCLMMADKITDLVKDMACERAVIIGGGSLNTAMIAILEKRLDGLEVPELAEFYEAYGAALWASKNQCKPVPLAAEHLVELHHHSFSVHSPLSESLHLVNFKAGGHDKVKENDVCILGLDVGSTTTKAVLLRKNDSSILASVYLRTNGDPVGAARECYKAIKEQVGSVPIKIVGLGVTGSGRQIAALHALTDSVINEIIAHATAAAYFDKEVDTIFEIGGQDAKYTFLTGGVPSDYAMNEACSAGTGSFLEESALESLNVKTEEIGELALKGDMPPNFTDQCSAFISSDIKIATQEGISRNNVLAGLVYSICMNYLNRVKGARPVGKKIFMQGGVCYNKAIPAAMAALMNCKIIVPPDPGLMGAYGVALEVLNRIDLGIIREAEFSLDTLIERNAVKEGCFTCAGGKEKCDRKCEIAKIRIEGDIFFFGGICNKYYNIRLNRDVDTDKYDLVAFRQKLLFEKYGVHPYSAPVEPDKPVRSVGIVKSFFTHSLYPLYSNFFNELGFKIILSDCVEPKGISRIEAAFCVPAEIAHGQFVNLLEKKPDYIFLPQVMQIPVENVPTYSRACVFVQGEPYYLSTTFRRELEESPVVMLTPVLKMGDGYETAEDTVVEMTKKMGISEKDARKAWKTACKKQQNFEKELIETGKKVIEYLDNNPDKFGIVLFGRPYNSFTSDANMGIPHKVASRGYIVIPHDMIPSAHYAVDKKMFWAMGQKIMKSAQFIKEKTNLFGFYITNFSCGPDSFLLGFFRRVMGSKPSLTLELDQHTADAGIDTRIEAALDIITSFRRMKSVAVDKGQFRLAKVNDGKSITITSSDGKVYPLNSPNVELLIPSMGRYGSEGVAAILRSVGINAIALPVADKDVLLEGRKNTSCKECLPYIVTTGSFLDYINKRKDPQKVTVLFMATGGGPCRLGQYCRALEHLVEKKQFENVAVLPMTDENGYGGLGSRNLLKAWQSVVISDVLGDIKSMLSVAAENREKALEDVENIWNGFIEYFEGRKKGSITSLLSKVAQRLKAIPLKVDCSRVPEVSLIGEIFVRRDEFSRKGIVEYLENNGFKVKVAPTVEYMCYSNYVVNTGLGERKFTFTEKIRMKLTAQIQLWWEKKIKSILAESGLYRYELVEVDKTIDGVKHLLNPNFRGETILTVGLGMREILNESCGVVAIGPFGCMPSRMAEAMLKKEMNIVGKRRMPGWEKRVDKSSGIGEFPFLSIETDGSPFPQLIEANLEAFVLQAKRLHEQILEEKTRKKTPFSLKIYDIISGNEKTETVKK